MALDTALAQLVAGDAVDRAIVDNLRHAKREDIEHALSKYLPKKHVDNILARIEALLDATESR